MRGIATVFRFEWKRSRTFPRMAWWVLLAAFPPLLLTLIRFNVGQPGPDELLPVPLVVFGLCPSVVCMLGVFLCATPWISSELEGRSWVYIAVRPRGALEALFGKYLVAVTWTVPAGLVSSALGVIIFSQVEWIDLIWIQWRLVVLSCLAYAAAFTLIGVLFPKRAMVVGVFYTILFEFVLASVPAAVNVLTVQYRLRCLLVRWIGVDEDAFGGNPLFLAYFGEESANWHIGVLLGMTVAFLGAAALVLRWKEFTVDAETGV
jgi:ABC-type transport system involved in multi-copper enzyme maturation permease subunit